MSEQNPLSVSALSLVRYLDVSVVVAVAPLFVLAGLPVLGYAIGAVAWLATRYLVDIVQRRARVSRNPGRQAALLLASMMGRVFAIVAAVLIARFVGSTDDGIAAAAVVLVAFTVYLLVTIAMRGGSGAHPGGSSRTKAGASS
jgi:hypothetical protein